MIDERLFELFNKDDVSKKVNIEILDSSDVIKNEDIYAGTFSFSDSLCSQDNLRFGSCESSSISFTMNNILSKLKGQTLIPYVQVGDNEDDIICLGRFIVDTDSPSEDKKSRKIHAYDSLYSIRNKDVTSWYNRLIFPNNLKRIRDSFFEFVGVDQVDIDLPNDGAYIYEYKNDMGSIAIYGSYILSDICQLNGCFGKINRDGLFDYVFLEKDTEQAIEIEKSIRKDLSYEDYITHDINQIKLTQSNSNIDFYYGTGDNSYPISLQVLQVGDAKNLLDIICSNIFDIISHIRFTPVNLAKRGNPCLQAGDFIKTESFTGDIIYSYILEKEFTIDSIQGTTDTITSQGKEIYTRDISNNYISIYDNERAITEISKYSFYAYTFTNEEAINTSSTEVIIVKFNISATSNADAIFICTLPIYLDLDGYVKIKYFIDGAEIQDDEVVGYYSAGNNIITISNFFKLNENGRLTLTLSISTEYVESDCRIQSAKIVSLEEYVKSGEYKDPSVSTTVSKVTIGRHKIKASLFAQGIQVGEKWDGTINVAESISMINIDRAVSLFSISDKVYTNVYIPYSANITESISCINISRSLDINPVSEELSITKIVMYYIINTDKADAYNYDDRYVLTDNEYSLKTDYTYYANDEDIDSGKMKVIKLDLTQYNVESVVINNE